jgi:hypothetical protein
MGQTASGGEEGRRVRAGEEQDDDDEVKGCSLT